MGQNREGIDGRVHWELKELGKKFKDPKIQHEKYRLWLQWILLVVCNTWFHFII